MQTRARQIKLSVLVTLLFACITAGILGRNKVNATSGLFEITGNGVLTAYIGNQSDVVIPEEVTVIGSKAFYNNSKVKTVIIPETVETIEGSAFEGCSNLKAVTMKEGMLSIEDRAFARCGKLVEVRVPSTVAALGQEVFYNDKGLQTSSLPDKITTLKQGLFMGCSSLKEVRLPKECYQLEASVFEGCISLKEIQFNEKLELLGDAVFKNCKELIKVTLPSSMKTIGQELFFGCKSLTQVELPATVKEIKKYSFYGCSSLEEVKIPAGVEVIGEAAFANCEGLKDIMLPSNLKILAIKVFDHCTSLESVVMPENAVEVKASAFRNCSSLLKLELPASLSKFDASALEGCKSLEAITVDDSNAVFESMDGSLYREDGTILVRGVVREGRFYVPSGVKTIGSFAFYNEDALKNIDFSGVSMIMDYAFYDCDSIETLRIPESLQRIGGYAFTGCEKISRIEVAAGNEWYTVSDGILYGTNKVEGDFAVVLVPKSKGGVLGIPETVGKSAVTAIETGAFSDCASLTKISLPDGITRIEGAAFKGCKNLGSINLPTGITVLNNDLFHGCAKLASIQIPSGVKELRAGVFYDCVSLTSITIPQATIEVYSSTFEGCKSLETIQVEAGNTSLAVENHMLYKISDAGKILVRGSVLAEGMLMVPEDVVAMGYHSLADCIKLTGVTVRGTLMKSITDPFDGLTSLKTFAVFADVDGEFSVELSKDTYLFTNSGSTGIKEYAASNQNPFYMIEEGEKVVPDYVVPMNLEAVKGQTLADVLLPDDFTFKEDLAITLDAAGAYETYVTYTPEDTTYLEIISDIPVTVVVRTQTFPITYYLNGGTNHKMNPSQYEESAAVVLQNPTRFGYLFMGWYTDEARTELFTGFTEATTGDITLYANWKAATYGITYQLNGGSVSGNPTTYQTIGTTITLKNPTRKGYTFAGWYQGSKKVTQIVKGSTGNITLTAKWNLATYKITYQLNGGTIAKGSPTTFNITTNTITLKNPTRKGYVFAGWYQGSKKVTQIKKGSTGNQTLTAKWTKVTVAKTVISSAKNNKAKTITTTVKKQNDVAGYVYEFTTDKNFKSGVKTATAKSNTCSLNKFTKGKTYYVRVYAYKLDSTGNKVAGAKSSVIKVAIKK